jgi:flagellar P-ring protein precursor FlgI
MKALLIWFSRLCLLLFATPVAIAQNVRIKDLANLRGDRPNSLIGYGLVVGLSKTGDTPAALTTNKAVMSLLSALREPTFQKVYMFALGIE